ncbi:LysR family transcriptional regulator [Ruegeria sp. MALMAid1280]|uniref:LysR family transcriptional regulator n=1 Tax=Ruegeria sp. MALMAid1280 TaxID=3411634 RepID=UPI003B9F7501
MADSKVNDILIFLAVADAGSFVAGGKRFGLTRSTAGKAVARLEERYGARLFNRTTRALSLTEEGQRLYQEGLAIRSAISNADAVMEGGDGTPTGTLRVAAPDAVGRRLLLPILRRFLAKWPDVRVDVSFSDMRQNLVEDGFDLAIRLGVTSPDRALISRVLTEDRPILVASPTYLEDHSAPTMIEHLSTHDLLQFSSDGQHQGWAFQDDLEFLNKAPGRVRIRFDSAEALREAAVSGMGIALLPTLLVKSDIESGELVRVLPKIDCGTIPIIALYPHRKFLEPRVRRFIDMLAGELQKSKP